jgi:hypothetical protein
MRERQMRQPALDRSLAWIGWGAMAVFAVLIGVVALRLLSFNVEAAAEEPFVLLVN